jgi:hypothetical protein
MRSKAILSEFGGNSTDLQCRTTIHDMLSFMENNADAFAGWAAWGTGLDITEKVFLDPANATRPTPTLENVIAAHMNSNISLVAEQVTTTVNSASIETGTRSISTSALTTKTNSGAGVRSTKLDNLQKLLLLVGDLVALTYNF